MATHAVVLGASMAGLGTAAVLARHFDRVTVVERDALPDGATTESRKGVPQGNHGHGLLASGLRILEDWFPGIADELVAGGASPGDVSGDFLWYQFGGWKLRAPCGLRGVVASRPLLEAKVRARVRALPNVELLVEHDGDEPVFDAERRRVTGLAITERATGTKRVLDAELVIDASGRGSRSPRWLASWGFGEVKQSLVRCDIAYATGIFDRRPGDFRGSIGGVIAGAPPAERRGGAAFAVEDDRWVLTLYGALGDHPPADVAGFRAFARSLPQPDMFELAREREPRGAIHVYKFPANRACHYEKLPRFPEGFLVIGDAVCSFNPIYAQGMAVAFGQAKALDECLAAGPRDLARRFFARAKALTQTPWAIATGEDMRFPEVEGPRPPGFAFVSRYMERAHQAATKDPVVLGRFFEVANLLRAPTAMLAPPIAVRVLLGGIGRS